MILKPKRRQILGGDKISATTKHWRRQNNGIHKIFFFFMFGGRIPLFLFNFHFFITYGTNIHSFNHIHTIHLSIAIRWDLSPSPHCLKAQWEDPPCGAELRIELPALQEANALPTEPRRTINWARRTRSISLLFWPGKIRSSWLLPDLADVLFSWRCCASTCSHQVCCCRWPPCFMGGLSPPLYWLICTGPPCRNITNVGVDTISTPAKISLIFAKL